MEIDDKLLTIIETLRNDISDIKTSIKVISTKQEETLRTFGRGSQVLDEHTVRLREVEKKQEKHASYFNIIGPVLLACLAGLMQLFTK